jgi:hypothetical protein
VAEDTGQWWASVNLVMKRQGLGKQLLLSFSRRHALHRVSYISGFITELIKM